MTHWRALVIAAVLLVSGPAAPAAARAADAVAPGDGEVVGSRPAFAFDFADGNATIELSRSAAVRAGGEDPGSFVDDPHSQFALIGDEGRQSGPITWEGTPSRLPAGRWLWHVKADDYADGMATPEAPAPWGPTRTLLVRDEPVVFEGWTVRARRLRAPGACARVSVAGTLAFSDNADAPAARYSITLTGGGRRVAVLRGRVDESDDDFSAVVCTRATRLRALAELRDPGGHLVRGPVRTLRLPRPPA